MSVSRAEHVEDFTIALEKSGDGCKLQMTWEKTQASVEIAKK